VRTYFKIHVVQLLFRGKRLWNSIPDKLVPARSWSS